jgi:hypothetical protein
MSEKFMSDVMVCYVEKDFSTMMSDDVIDLFKVKDRGALQCESHVILYVLLNVISFLYIFPV